MIQANICGRRSLLQEQLTDTLPSCLLVEEGEPGWPNLNLCETHNGHQDALSNDVLCNCRHTMCVKWLLEQGANPLDVTRNGKESGLHQAAAGHVRALTTLLNSTICTATNTGPQLLSTLLIQHSSGSHR